MLCLSQRNIVFSLGLGLLAGGRDGEGVTVKGRERDAVREVWEMPSDN